ncbi:MAG TPA: hypothetical protein VFU65_03990 [Actinocrinis sp.]|nr:hypothetical protein [Actinocrinis sp.]
MEESEDVSRHPEQNDPLVTAYFRAASRGGFAPEEIRELARGLSLSAAACAEVVGRLQTLGLLIATTDPEFFRPAHPRVASPLLLELAESAFERRKRALRLAADRCGDSAAEATAGVRAVHAQIEELAGATGPDDRRSRRNGRGPVPGTARGAD